MDWENEDDDFLEQAQRRAKRNFLHEEILEAGFSGSLFTTFCEQERSSDIDQWSFEDLQDCVRRFKAKVTEEEFKEKPKTEGERREESPKSHVVPAEVKRDASPPATDTATRPKLVEVQSSPLDRFRADSKDYTKTAYHSSHYDFATAPKDLPKPAIILPHLKAESPKPPAVIPEPLVVPQKESPLQKPVAYSPEIKPLRQSHGMFPLMPPQSSEVVVQKPVKVTEAIPLKPAQATEVIPQKLPPVPEVTPQESQTSAEVTPQKVRDQSSEAVLPVPIPSPEVPILTKPEEKTYKRKQVSMSFLLADGPASLLPSADYAIPGHTLPSTELSSHSSCLKVIIEK